MGKKRKHRNAEINAQQTRNMDNTTLKEATLSTIYIARTFSLTEPISKDTGLEKHTVLKDISKLLPTWLTHNTKRNITW